MNPVAPFPDPNIQAAQDAEHLRLLSIFYYVVAGILALSGLMFLIHIIMGLALVTGSMGPSSSVSPSAFPSSPRAGSNNMPPGFGWIFVVMGTFALLSFEILAGFTFYAGRCLARREKKTLIQVVAALLCLHVPIGTVLGVFTFIVLGRPSVAHLFGAPLPYSSAPISPPPPYQQS